MDGVDAIAAISRFVARFGVTTWLPTLTPRPTIAELADVIRLDLPAIGTYYGGAEAAGFHLEGPFLSPKRPGSIRLDWFRLPSVAETRLLLDTGAGHVRLMTLAPENGDGLGVVRTLVAAGATASIGHSDARAEQVREAIGAGVRHATHAFNAMRPLHHRDPGVVGAMLVADDVRAELIADEIHVDPVAMGALLRAKGSSRVVLITDAVKPAGLPDGNYDFDGRPIVVKDGMATLADGTIAGSVATFDGNVRRMVQECGTSLADAALMAATIPARAVGLAQRKGNLAGGRDADLVALDDQLRVRLTLARGEVVYRDD